MSFFVQRAPAQPLAPALRACGSAATAGNRCATSGCYELEGQSDWRPIQARTSRSTSVTRRSRLVSHALCIADVPDGQTYLPMRGRPLQPVPRAVAYWMPSVVAISMLPNPRLRRPSTGVPV
jgi:hypothetical protein